MAGELHPKPPPQSPHNAPILEDTLDPPTMAAKGRFGCWHRVREKERVWFRGQGLGPTS